MKEKHKPSKANEVTVKAPRKGGGEEAGRALSGTRPQGDSEETLRVKAAGTEPALVNTAAAGRVGPRPPPHCPFLLSSRRPKLCVMYRQQQAGSPEELLRPQAPA